MTEVLGLNVLEKDKTQVPLITQPHHQTAVNARSSFGAVGGEKLTHICERNVIDFAQT